MLIMETLIVLSSLVGGSCRERCLGRVWELRWSSMGLDARRPVDLLNLPKVL